MSFLPFLFVCWECERSHALVEGEYVVEKNDPPLRAKDTRFFCIPCAERVFGTDAVASVLTPA